MSYDGAIKPFQLAPRKVLDCLMDHLVRFAALEELASLLSAGMKLESRLDDLGYRQLREIFLHELLPVSLRLVFDRIKYGLIETDQFL